MFNHAPEDYICPICLGIQGFENYKTLIRNSDVVYQDKEIMVFIASYFIGNNPGHLIVVPVQHYEHMYDLPDEIGAQVFSISRKMAVAMKKVYDCAGVMILQNNEPASGQHAFHYHMHLIPRYENDDVFNHMSERIETTIDQRAPYAEKMKKALI